MPVEQRVERTPRELQEVAVAHGDDRRGARLAGEERELADRRAATDLLEDARAPLVVDHAPRGADR